MRNNELINMKKYWDEIPEVDEPLSKEEKEQLAKAEKDDEYLTVEELKRELFEREEDK